MYRVESADGFACQLTNSDGYDVAEVVRHGRKVDGDDAAGWAVSRGLPVEHHTTDDEWKRMLKLINAAPDLLTACRKLFDCLGDWVEIADKDADTVQDEAALEFAYEAIRKAEEGSDARV